MAGKRKRESPPPTEEWRQSLRRSLRIAGWMFGIATTVFVGAAALLEGEQFLSHDARFRLPERGAAAHDDAVTVNGLRHASMAAVMRVFEEDRGRGLIDIDPEQRRQALRRLDWVRDASVRRVWPNHLHVEIIEREPVAFIQVPAGLSGDFADPLRYTPKLIDGDGVILPVAGTPPRGLTLLGGVHEQDDVERRRARVLQMLRILDELSSVRGRVVEIDLADPENVRIGLRMPDRQVMLILGNERFKDRIATFDRHYDGIRDRLPEGTVLDVSLDGRITAINGAEERKR